MVVWSLCSVCTSVTKSKAVIPYSRFRHLCNRKAARTKTTSVVNSISHRQLYRNSFYNSTNSTRVVSQDSLAVARVPEFAIQHFTLFAVAIARSRKISYPVWTVIVLLYTCMLTLRTSDRSLCLGSWLGCSFCACSYFRRWGLPTGTRLDSDGDHIHYYYSI